MATGTLGNQSSALPAPVRRLIGEYAPVVRARIVEELMAVGSTDSLNSIETVQKAISRALAGLGVLGPSPEWDMEFESECVAAAERGDVLTTDELRDELKRRLGGTDR